MHDTSTDREIEYARAQHHRLVGWVSAETNQQLSTWNVQNHPLGTGPKVRVLAHTDINLDLRYGEELAFIFRDECEARFGRGEGTWRDILLEEVFEAMAEEDPEKLEKELIQVAAVAVSMAAASRRARGA